MGGATPLTTKSSFWDGDINWFTFAEMDGRVYLNESIRKITKYGFDSSSLKMLPIGTVLFSTQAGIGKSAILSKEGCTNQGFHNLIPKKDEITSYFLYTITPYIKRYAERIATGGTFYTKISGNQLAEIPIYVLDIKEQTKIGAI